MPPLPNRDVLRYLRLEEDEDTADILLPASIRYVGAHEGTSGESHYWSYPTAKGVSWAELDPRGSLGTCDDAPQPIRDATAARADHKFRHISRRQEAPPLTKRTKPDHAVWVPLSNLPACNYHQAWYENTSFETALKHYGAKAIRDGSAGPGTRYFYVQLTSGRYACIETRRDFPQTVIISLEVDTRRAGKNSGGKVYVRDIEEVLAPMGGTFKMPSTNLYIGWSTDA